MRTAFAIVALTALLLVPRASAAKEYPWCAVQFDTDGDITSCGYVSRQQCMDTVFGGVGGYCRMNPYATAPQLPSTKPAVKKKRHS